MTRHCLLHESLPFSSFFLQLNPEMFSSSRVEFELFFNCLSWWSKFSFPVNQSIIRIIWVEDFFLFFFFINIFNKLLFWSNNKRFRKHLLIFFAAESKLHLWVNKNLQGNYLTLLFIERYHYFWYYFSFYFLLKCTKSKWGSYSCQYLFFFKLVFHF